ncbi:SDR family NAD(P)-dependent oxidoreductase [Nocardia alba]|uniref:SDR family NAD(P)-dependent oxidoreductase n=1 Tax=Nocardia alba TaxID=225051 RepID=UPI001FB42C4D|nr:SDR family NAD(P)-dependent oxidoreductase [Nocardia alba]
MTGASSGIGLATVRRLSAAGLSVFGAARSDDRLRDALSPLVAGGARIGWKATDVTKTDEIHDLVDAVLDRFGRIDVLVNNAGRSGGGEIGALPDQLWDEVLATNLTSVFYLTREVLGRKEMVGRGWGRIVNVASTAGKQGVVFASPYCASKHGVLGLTRAVALEVVRSGITVNAVCPGYVETPLAVRVRQGYADHWGRSEQEVLDEFVGKVPLGRYSTADEVASMIEYVASDAAASVTGQALNVCGGLGRY